MQNVLLLFFPSYDHLSECLSRILDERPKNVLGKKRYYIIVTTFKHVFPDIFEQVSEFVKKDRIQPKSDTLQVS